jgi:hypothetical protein
LSAVVISVCRPDAMFEDVHPSQPAAGSAHLIVKETINSRGTVTMPAMRKLSLSLLALSLFAIVACSGVEIGPPPPDRVHGGGAHGA